MTRQHPHAHRINSSEQVAIGATSAQSGTCPFGTGIAHIKAHGTSGSPSNFFKVGGNPTATTDGTSSFIHDKETIYVIVRPDSSLGAGDGEKIATINTSGSAILYIDWVES